jgi:hypothetical protein
MDQETVGTYTGLPSVSKFTGHGSIDGLINVRVGKYNKWSVSSQL